MRKHIIILTGGNSAEKEISIKSADLVEYVLKKHYKTSMIFCSSIKEIEFFNEKKEKIELKKYIKENKIQAVLVMIHGAPGENGIISKYLKKINIPYTNCDEFQSALTFNKNKCNNYLKEKYKINVPHSIYFENIFDEKKFNKSQIKFPCFVKPNNGGSSFGASIAKNITDLKTSFKNASKYDNEVIVEEFIKGKELTCGTYSINKKIMCLPITEIRTENDFFDYDAKYKGLSEEITPAKINKNTAKKVIETSKKIYKKLNLKGIVRIDYIIKENKPYMIEVNTIPGMSKESIIPQQIKSTKIDIGEFISTIIEECIKINQ